MPQLDVSTFFSQFFWLIVSFSFLYALLSKVCLPKITKILEERDLKISGALKKAEEAKEEASRLKSEYELNFANAVRSKNILIADSIKNISKMMEEKMLEHDRSFKVMLDDAEKRIDSFQENSRDDIDKIAREATQRILSSLIGTDIDKEVINTALQQAKKSGD